jgi:GGDEF domain-containing protein
LRVSASIGIAVSENGQDAEELLRRADKAMYRVKLSRSVLPLGR